MGMFSGINSLLRNARSNKENSKTAGADDIKTLIKNSRAIRCITFQNEFERKFKMENRSNNNIFNNCFYLIKEYTNSSAKNKITTEDDPNGDLGQLKELLISYVEKHFMEKKNFQVDISSAIAQLSLPAKNDYDMEAFIRRKTESLPSGKKNANWFLKSSRANTSIVNEDAPLNIAASGAPGTVSGNALEDDDSHRSDASVSSEAQMNEVFLENENAMLPQDGQGSIPILGYSSKNRDASNLRENKGNVTSNKPPVDIVARTNSSVFDDRLFDLINIKNESGSGELERIQSSDMQKITDKDNLASSEPPVKIVVMANSSIFDDKQFDLLSAKNEFRLDGLKIAPLSDSIKNANDDANIEENRQFKDFKLFENIDPESAKNKAIIFNFDKKIIRLLM